VEEGQLVQLGA